MLRKVLWRNALVALSGVALLLTPGTGEAQRRGWGWGPGGYDPWGYHSVGRSTSVSNAQAPSNLQYYAAETLTDPRAAGFTLRLPDSNTEVWFENQKTQQKGIIRQYVSGSLDPSSSYTFHIRARWTDNGRPVEQTRNIDARAGQQLTVDFTTPPAKRVPATSPRN
jgi:uncharacterized protein (TIGR03000 family)